MKSENPKERLEVKFGRNQTDVNLPNCREIRGRDNNHFSRRRKISRYQISKYQETSKGSKHTVMFLKPVILGQSCSQIKIIKGTAIQLIPTHRNTRVHTHTQHPSHSLTYTESIKENNIRIKLRKNHPSKYIQQNDILLPQKFLGRMKTLSSRA